jgi:hypothetical protein
MNLNPIDEFKVGDIVEVLPTRYTTALIVKLTKSAITPGKVFGECLPMFGSFPIGHYTYDLGKAYEWQIVTPAEAVEYRTNIVEEAAKVLNEAWGKRAIDNLTYIELLSILNERAKSK